MSNVFLKNTSARRITINVSKGESYEFLPAGDNVSVPELALESAFVKSLIADGSLVNMGPDTSSDERASLIAQAELLGIPYDKRWGNAKFKTEIAKATATGDESDAE